MNKYLPARKTIKDAAQVEAMLDEQFRYVVVVDQGKGPVDIYDQAMEIAFLPGMNRAPLKKLSAQQAAERINCLVLLAKLDERGCKTIHDAFVAILRIISKESPLEYEAAASALCDFCSEDPSTPMLNCFDLIAAVINPEYGYAQTLFSTLEAARGK